MAQADSWIRELNSEDPGPAWDAFIASYRRLIFAAIRHYVRDYDDVMDVFAHVCELLRADNLRRLREYVADSEHTARFSTWLVIVVRNLTVDWFRARDGRRRPPAFVEALPELQRAIFAHVFLKQCGHIECYEMLRTDRWPDLTYRAFLTELRNTYTAATGKHRGAVWQDLAGYAPDNNEDFEHAIDARLSYARAAEALAALPHDDRLAVQLYILDGLKADEVARVLGLPGPKAVYNRVYRALAALKAELEGAGIGRRDL